MVESDPPMHPIAHIDSLKCYEWMLAECASANAQRQAREDGLVGTVTQISSAAILAVPGFALATGSTVPSAGQAPLLYVGLVGFGLALLCAMAEQHFSSVAYAKHIEVVQAYYTKQSEITEDAFTRLRVRVTRWLAYAFFATALFLTAIGLLTLKG